MGRTPAALGAGHDGMRSRARLMRGGPVWVWGSDGPHRRPAGERPSTATLRALFEDDYHCGSPPGFRRAGDHSGDAVNQAANTVIGLRKRAGQHRQWRLFPSPAISTVVRQPARPTRIHETRSRRRPGSRRLICRCRARARLSERPGSRCSPPARRPWNGSDAAVLRAVLSIVALLVVVLVVMSLGRTQLQAVAPNAPSAAPGAEAPANRVQQAGQDVQRALEAGAAARASEAGQ